MNYSATKNDIKKIVGQIESLAKDIQSIIDNGGDHLATSNELVRNTTTLVFALGEVWAAEQLATQPKSVSNKVYYRDSRGRFARKV